MKVKVKFEGENGTSEYYSHSAVTYGISVDKDNDRIIDEDGCSYDEGWHGENRELVAAIRWAKRKRSYRNRNKYDPWPSIVPEYPTEF